MEAANLQMTGQTGELVLQTGRQSGARRPLSAPVTLIGRAATCDFRLNVDGVDPVHCVVALGAGGIQVRDLDSTDGTLVNGERVQQAALQHGDLLQVGPIEFRVELSQTPCVTDLNDPPVDELRQALRIQAAAVAAQQAALEEEEIRLQKRRSDMQRQEEQLAAHLAQKQQEVQAWSDSTRAERETLYADKVEQQRRLAQIEADFLAATEKCRAEHQQLTHERKRVGQVYERLRERWKKQWAAEREKHRQRADELRAERNEVEERHALVRLRESALEQEVERFTAACEEATGQLQDGRASLENERVAWRRRRSLEMMGLKNKARELDDVQRKLQEARALLVSEKNAWGNQLDTLKQELIGLNNRIVHQRARVQEQREEIAKLDDLVSDRRRQIAEPPSAEGEPIEVDVEVIADSIDTPGPEADLDRLATELADQRVLIVEQFAYLAEIQDAWQQARDRACADLEALAQRLQAEEQSLGERGQQAENAESAAHELQREAEAMRRDVALQRTQLQGRAQAFERDCREQLQLLAQKESLLHEQLAGLTQIRLRWNLRRQEEVSELRSQRTLVRQQQKEAIEARVELFGKEQAMAEERRVVVEKAIALEQYRQEVLLRTKDPAAQKRLERLRRRWLTLNAALIRNAKRERDAAKAELSQLESLQAELTLVQNRLNENDAALTEKAAEFDERAAVQQARQAQLEVEVAQLVHDRRQADEKCLRLQDEVETLAKAVYDEPDTKAA